MRRLMPPVLFLLALWAALIYLHISVVPPKSTLITVLFGHLEPLGLLSPLRSRATMVDCDCRVGELGNEPCTIFQESLQLHIKKRVSRFNFVSKTPSDTAELLQRITATFILGGLASQLLMLWRGDGVGVNAEEPSMSSELILTGLGTP
ncbi:hypothetical protein C8J56DRAFT_890801 [Mycena floridula]|nr:hypothetical protein C8J56DRAFT_890801 [Mycena floridula]